MHRGDYGIYGVIDQQLYRTKNGDGDSGVSVFRRGSVSPSDRNRVSFYLDGGIVFKGMVPNRPNDSFGAAIIYARFPTVFVPSIRIDPSGPSPRRLRYEANLDLLAQIVPGWIIQPVYTYIWHPSGTGVRLPTHKSQARSVIRF